MNNIEKIKESLSTEEAREKIINSISEKWATKFPNEPPISKDVIEAVLNMAKKQVDDIQNQIEDVESLEDKDTN